VVIEQIAFVQCTLQKYRQVKWRSVAPLSKA
jgi:hypothetical protein